MLDGTTLVERAYRVLAAVCADVVVASAGRVLVPGAEHVEDGPGQGPAAAVLGAAARRPGHALLVLACDLPRVPLALLERLVALPGDWVAPRHQGGIEPLCALYRDRAIAALAEQVARGELALHRLESAPALVVRYLDAVAVEDLGDPRELFANVNSRRDLERLAGR
jgi:molybdopterin-guanine dinucleotide biosynthesis protein A